MAEITEEIKLKAQNILDEYAPNLPDNNQHILPEMEQKLAEGISEEALIKELSEFLCKQYSGANSLMKTVFYNQIFEGLRHLEFTDLPWFDYVNIAENFIGTALYKLNSEVLNDANENTKKMRQHSLDYLKIRSNILSTDNLTEQVNYLEKILPKLIEMRDNIKAEYEDENQ